MLTLYIFQVTHCVNVFLEAVNFCCYYGFILYSGVSNKRTGMFINFWPIFPPVRPYLDQYVYFLWTINDFVLLQMAYIHKKLYFWANNFIPICLFGAVCLFILTKFPTSTLIWSSTFIRNLRVHTHTHKAGNSVCRSLKNKAINLDYSQHVSLMSVVEFINSVNDMQYFFSHLMNNLKSFKYISRVWDRITHVIRTSFVVRVKYWGQRLT